MGEYQGGLDLAFHALAHPVRRSILDRLRGGPARVTDLAAPFDSSLNTVSKHLRVLEEARLVRRTKRGREHHLELQAGPLQDAARWVTRYEQFWSERLDALEAVLAERKEQRPAKPPKPPKPEKKEPSP